MRDTRGRDSVIDVFSGVGGLSLGAARAGFSVAAAVEIDPRASQSHHRNFPNSNTLTLDVRGVSGAQLLAAAGIKRGGLSGLIGSPPCQGFSSIGRKNADDRRNYLFVDFFRLVQECQPVFFVAENVPGIMQPQNSVLRKAAFDIVEDDYDLVAPFTAIASDFGAPTLRKRVFFVGVRRDLGLPSIDADALARSRKHPVSVSHALRGLPAQVADDWRDNVDGLVTLRPVKETVFSRSLCDARPAGVGDEHAFSLLAKKRRVFGHQGTVHSAELRRRYAMLAEGESDPITKSTRLIASGFCPTLRAGTARDKGAFQAVRPIHHREARVITPREAARLQSFPDWFVFHQTKWHSFRQIGNSVPPLLAEGVFRNLRKALGL